MGATAEWEMPDREEGREDHAEFDDEPLSDEIQIHARDDSGDGEEADSGADPGAEDDPDEDESQETQVIEAPSGDWLSEVSRDARETLEWPASAGRTEHDRVDTRRVRHLFPVPDDTDWNVGELEYSRDKATI
jgi:hypothetical protein